MPTSGAVDLVAKRLNLRLFETPTGWKFFGNVMDSKTMFGGEELNPVVCGEESFGTGSNHVREKDGMWAVLTWMSILASYNSDASKPFVHVEDIVRKHWASYGRNTLPLLRGVEKSKANALMDHLRASFASLPGKTFGSFTVGTADEFCYVDPIDGSVSPNQGIRVLMVDGSRVVFRLSGTAGSGATVRMYLEKYESNPELVGGVTREALKELVGVAFEISKIVEITGFTAPTVIT